jgi:hypothetical protein
MLSRVCRNELSSGWLLCQLLNLAVDLVFVAHEVAHVILLLKFILKQQACYIFRKADQ